MILMSEETPSKVISCEPEAITINFHDDLQAVIYDLRELQEEAKRQGTPQYLVITVKP